MRLLLHQTALANGTRLQGVGRQIDKTPARARSCILCGKHNAPDARVDRRPRTHGARFKCDVKRTVRKPPPTKLFTSRLNRQNLGMRGGTSIVFAQVMRAGNHLSIPSDDSPHWGSPPPPPPKRLLGAPDASALLHTKSPYITAIQSKNRICKMQITRKIIIQGVKKRVTARLPEMG